MQVAEWAAFEMVTEVAHLQLAGQAATQGAGRSSPASMLQQGNPRKQFKFRLSPAQAYSHRLPPLTEPPSNPPNNPTPSPPYP